jgi:hypothetical protein
MSDAGMSDVMQSVQVDSDDVDSGSGDYEYDSDDNEDDYSEQDEYVHIEEKVSSPRLACISIMHDIFSSGS